ncbi:hypothetical protein CP533_3787 [Ophiocordyceps camponoti-saundersi (nom. inval.)]|nr:hypothetical protein CP533_3787 [Ophiocordyceps camponoti-saundersi (nom. inval.)]
MVPIPVYSASPINAASETPTPTDKNQNKTQPPATTTRLGLEGRQHAQPGAVPALPAATGVPQPAPVAAIPSRVSPPAPQPGPAPAPPGLPPPPKAGETAAAAAKQQSQAPAQTTTPPQVPLQVPPQLSYQAPAAAQPIQGRSSTMADPHGHMGGRGSYPTSVHSTGVNASSAGYGQGTQLSYGGSGYPHQQPFSGPQNSITTSPAEVDDQSPGVWDTARKWASAAGESLAAAESEVWKRINKS